MLFFNDKKQISFFPIKEEYSSYEELKKTAIGCNKCRLRQGCTQVVFGIGNLETHLMLVGEGPGKDEDLIGEPFVGKAGQLLYGILEAAAIKKEDIYITNVVKCRPPGNRTPSIHEIKECIHYLYWEIRLLKPAIIVPLGSTALKGLLDPSGSIVKSRGQWIKRDEYNFLPTYHPAALLRDIRKKRPTWEDFLKIKGAYERYQELRKKTPKPS